MGAEEQSKAVSAGASAAVALLATYFAVLSAVSGPSFAQSQFAEFWPYVVTLAAGFGVQVGLYVHLRHVTTRLHQSHCAIAVSGTTAAAAMLACCTHYLANVLPVLGAVGLVTFAAQYQIQLFWVGLAFNAAGLAFVGRQVYAASQALREKHA